jgi:hypothetical protein
MIQRGFLDHNSLHHITPQRPSPRAARSIRTTNTKWQASRMPA